jgi:hypothetical protein
MSVKELIEALGSTSEEVAQSLLEKSIRGSHSLKQCPLAKYLQKETGVVYWVGTKGVLNGEFLLEAELTEAATQFIVDYDLKGKYKELEVGYEKP